MDKRIIAIVLFAALVTVFGAGSFLKESGDPYYSYVATRPTTVNIGQPIEYSVSLSGGEQLSGCDDSAISGLYADTDFFCDSFTYINARSFRVKIDGTEVANYYGYPNGVVGATLTTQLPEIGAVCCYAACGACSVCSDQNNAGTQGHRAYFFGREVAPKTSLSGNELFALSIPNNLPPGEHNVEVQYFAETVNWRLDNSCPNAYTSRLSGQEYGDQNNRFNYYDTFTINIPGVVVNDTLACDDDGVCEAGESTANCAGDCPAVVTPPANNIMLYIAIGAAALFAWKFLLKRKS